LGADRAEQFEPWKHVDARLYAAGKSHVFELLGIRHAGAAAGLLRRFNEVSGIAALEDRVGTAGYRDHQERPGAAGPVSRPSGDWVVRRCLSFATISEPDE